MGVFSNFKVWQLMSNQVKTGGVCVCSNPQHCLRSYHSSITCIDKTCHISKGLINMHRVPIMAKVIILCYAHLLNCFRVNKGHICVQYFVYCVASSLLSWVTHAHPQWEVFNKCIASGTGLQQCIGSSHTWLLICVCPLPPGRTTTTYHHMLP